MASDRSIMTLQERRLLKTALKIRRGCRSDPSVLDAAMVLGKAISLSDKPSSHPVSVPGAVMPLMI